MPRAFHCFPIVALLTCVAAAQTTPATYKAIEVKNGGSITGQVLWDGPVPKEASTEVPVNPNQQAPCLCRKISVDRLKIDPTSRGLADCVVYIEKIEAGKALPAAGTDLMTGKEALLDQIGCRYVPAVMVVPPATEIVVTSSDNTSHNVNARLGAEQRFNLLITRKGAKEHGPKTSVGAKPGVISLSCNAGHPWMSGYIHVVTHPYYAVTDKDGRFALKDVPPGKYKLICWHASWVPRLLRDGAGLVTEVQYMRPVEVSQPVTVPAGAAAPVTFKVSTASAQGKKPPAAGG